MCAEITTRAVEHAQFANLEMTRDHRKFTINPNVDHKLKFSRKSRFITSMVFNCFMEISELEVTMYGVVIESRKFKTRRFRHEVKFFSTPTPTSPITIRVKSPTPGAKCTMVCVLGSSKIGPKIFDRLPWYFYGADGKPNVVLFGELCTDVTPKLVEATLEVDEEDVEKCKDLLAILSGETERKPALRIL